MTMDPPLVTLGQAKPSLKIEVVLDLLELSRADKKAGQEADHQRGHVLANWILIPLESIDQLLELLLAILATLPSRFQGRGYLLDVLDVLSD
jgi:signal transduction histidine kinase